MTDKDINLADLLKHGSHDEIVEKLYKELWKIGDYCDSIMGEGFFGKVYTPTVGPFIYVKIDNVDYPMYVVIKKTKFTTNYIGIDKVDDDLIINCHGSLTGEAIMLYIISKHWYYGKNLHLPFMVGFGICDSTNSTNVDNIILERHGSLYNSTLNFEKMISTPIYNLSGFPNYKNTWYSTVNDVFNNILLSIVDSDNCLFKLPSKKEIYLYDLIDHFAIFFIHTTLYLWNNFGMTLSDQHFNNIFVHWKTEFSRCGKKSLKNVENVYYEIGKNKYIKIPIYDFIFKIGDIGCSVMKIQENVLIAGDVGTAEALKKVKIFKEKHNVYVHTIINLLHKFPINIVKNTSIYKIFEENDILSKYIPEIGLTYEFDKKCPTELDILNNKHFKKWTVDNYTENDNNFVVNIN